MNLLIKIIRKLFLIREIVSRAGVVHFRRYRVISTPWFNIYIHHILQSDQDQHLHDHPFNFRSFVLKGSYREYYAVSPHWGDVKRQVLKRGSTVYRDHTDAHKLEVIDGPAWTLVLASPHRYDWGYQTEIGFVDHKRYRAWKDGESLLVPWGRGQRLSFKNES